MDSKKKSPDEQVKSIKEILERLEGKIDFLYIMLFLIASNLKASNLLDEFYYYAFCFLFIVYLYYRLKKHY